MQTWREHFRPIIEKLIACVGRDDERALRQSLRAAFPLTPKEGYPYKIWLDEINAQLGVKARKRKLQKEHLREDQDRQSKQQSLFT